MWKPVIYKPRERPRQQREMTETSIEMDRVNHSELIIAYTRQIDLNNIEHTSNRDELTHLVYTLFVSQGPTDCLFYLFLTRFLTYYMIFKDLRGNKFNLMCF